MATGGSNQYNVLIPYQRAFLRLVRVLADAGFNTTDCDMIVGTIVATPRQGTLNSPMSIGLVRIDEKSTLITLRRGDPKRFETLMESLKSYRDPPTS